MRHRMPLAIACLLIVAGILPAQERIPLPPPDPDPPGGPSTPTLDARSYQAPAPPNGPPQPYAPPPGPDSLPPGSFPYSPYAPPGGVYAPGPYYPHPIFLHGSPDNPAFWIGFEALVWWTKNQPLSVPIVTTGPASQGANAGNLGMPGTTSLNGPLDYGAAGGIRWIRGRLVRWRAHLGMDGSMFVLGRQSAGFSVLDRSGTGNFVINEPVVGAPFITQVSAPGVDTGGVVVGATSQFWGGDVNLLYNLYRGNGWTINLLGGYRYLELDESLTITANSTLFTTTTYTDNMGNVLATAPPGSTVAGDRSVRDPEPVQRRAARRRVPVSVGALVHYRDGQAGHRRHA